MALSIVNRASATQDDDGQGPAQSCLGYQKYENGNPTKERDIRYMCAQCQEVFAGDSLNASPKMRDCKQTLAHAAADNVREVHHPSILTPLLY